ncbi:hypothetical protein AMAG_19844 [Allomyces macrogynus ATCC 38327]|uniref:Uncharacterized protein n=1 Tax=Allomyces macrogynus (strain ATCC 38327) TaxID=578462 RepID=A0A0L0SZZ9_ALLM3|nr:hypothetical protein AMAG_19844 [Allomyces macrogynus ATCC 38327]|eukprot:KNE68081.1 hypothetical protein AMAG_19844 [Allomyces macrogynus ATCC 38327]
MPAQPAARQLHRRALALAAVAAESRAEQVADSASTAWAPFVGVVLFVTVGGGAVAMAAMRVRRRRQVPLDERVLV